MVREVEPTTFWLIIMGEHQKSKKKQEQKQEKIIKSKRSSSAVVDVSPERPFDFGGLPDRDLKKNLGC